MVKEFKEFIMRGNVLDMAVGIVIGVAFGAIVTSFVNDLLMPLIGLLLGGMDFSNFYITLKEGATSGPYSDLAAAKAAGAVTWNYGIFINSVVSFLIVAFAIFFLVKGVNASRRMKEETPPEPPTTPEEILLLREIRDNVKR